MVLKRFVSVLVAVFMLVGILAGCGAANQTDDVTTSTSVASTETELVAPPEEEEAKPVVLTIWVNANQQTQDSLDQEARFLAKYPNITLNKVLVNEGAGTDAVTAFAAGTNPDCGNTGAPTMASYAYAGMALPLDDYFAQWPDFSHISKEVADNFSIAGKHYALPFANYTMVLCYNKSIFAGAGLQPPKSWDEWLDTSVKLTDPSKQQWGMNMLVSYWTEWWFEYFVWMAGGDLTKQNDDGMLTPTFTDPAVAKAVEFYRMMIAAKCIQPDLTLDYGNLQNQFSAGHAAMTLYGSDGLHNFVGQGMKAEDVGYAELPIGPSGKPVSQMGGGVDFIYSNVSKEKADAAWAWIAFKASKEEMETSLKLQADKGGADPFIAIRDDLDMSLGKINTELQDIVDKCAAVSRLEFYGKGVVGGYVDKAVQKTIFDPKADIVKTFQEQQDLAKADIDAFNQKVLDSKK